MFTRPGEFSAQPVEKPGARGMMAACSNSTFDLADPPRPAGVQVSAG
jgi:hypothetical protein